MGVPSITYSEIQELSVKGRYVALNHLEPVFQKITAIASVEEVGKSVLGKSIRTITLGSGKRKVLMWSQMHGNESTTTKAVLDLLGFLQTSDAMATNLLATCTLKIIPMLNPDGAEAYTRVNANEIDLNRDAQTLSQPESKTLRNVYKGFKPDFCFNLHDQRTIFNVGTTTKPATVSFLAPAADEQRSIPENRSAGMQLIVAMNQRLQTEIPGQVGRYDDAFNPNCVGDTFQMAGTPTVLFEAGHFPHDYEREKTRKYIYDALLHALGTIANDRLNSFAIEDYFTIPENSKQFYDVLIRNPHRIWGNYLKGQFAAIQYKETLENNKIHFKPELCTLEKESTVFGHVTFDCEDVDDLNLLKKESYWSLLS